MGREPDSRSLGAGGTLSKHDLKPIAVLNRTDGLGWPEDEKRHRRFYLFAGMGGRAARRKHKRILRWAVLVGILVSAALGAVLFLLNGLVK